MKRYLRPLGLAAIMLLALIMGLILGESGGISSLWLRAKSWVQGHAMPAPSDPALAASLPVPDQSTGLPPSPLNDLLKPDLTPQQQTSIVGQMLLDYYSSVHALPVGTWEETVAQLAGRNRQKLALISKDHPALGPEGFRASPQQPSIRIHIISASGGIFQLIYDGPDGRPFTDDDLVRNFPPDFDFK